MRKNDSLNKKLIKLVKQYNPDFSDEILQGYLEEGTLDFFYDVTGEIPETDIHLSNANRINDMYNELRESYSPKENKHSQPEMWNKERYLGMSSIPTKSEHLGRTDFLNKEDTFIMDAFDDGGTTKDLFEDYTKIPSNIQSILDKYELEDSDYPVLENLKKELESVGYTFDYGLDAEPYGLRTSTTSLNELEGYEEFMDGGSAGNERVRLIGSMVVLQLSNNETVTLGSINEREKQLRFSPFATKYMKEWGRQWANKNGYSIREKFKKGGALKPIPEGNKGLPKLPEEVRNRMGYMNDGGSVNKPTVMERSLINQNALNIIKEKGNDLNKYSEYELKEIRNFVSNNELQEDVASKMWGLAIKHNFEYKHSTALIINSSTGNILNFVSDDFSKVDAINSDKEENEIARLLNNKNVLDIYSDSLKTINSYDIAIVNSKEKVNMSDLNLACKKLKTNKLLIFVSPNSLVFGTSNESMKIKNYLNEKFDLLESYSLPKDYLDCTLSVFKKL